MNGQDRDDFVHRLSGLVLETWTQCLAWALIPNHFHLLLQTGSVPIASLMRRLLTGYAARFHKRPVQYAARMHQQEVYENDTKAFRFKVATKRQRAAG